MLLHSHWHSPAGTNKTVMLFTLKKEELNICVYVCVCVHEATV